MTYTLDGMSSLGTVTNEESTKDAGLFQQPLPASNSSSAILIDIFGTSRTITVSGIFTGTTGDIQTFISELDALVNGTQTSTKTFHSDKSNANYEVLINSVSWSSEEGAVGKINYNITMTEGVI